MKQKWWLIGPLVLSVIVSWKKKYIHAEADCLQRWLHQSSSCCSTCITGLGCSSPKDVKPISCPLETDWPALTNRMWRKWQGDRVSELSFKRSCSFCFHCLGTRFSTKEIRGRVPGGLRIEDREIPEFHSSQLRSQTWDWEHLRFLGEYV